MAEVVELVLATFVSDVDTVLLLIWVVDSDGRLVRREGECGILDVVLVQELEIDLLIGCRLRPFDVDRGLVEVFLLITL